MCHFAVPLTCHVFTCSGPQDYLHEHATSAVTRGSTLRGPCAWSIMFYNCCLKFFNCLLESVSEAQWGNERYTSGFEPWLMCGPTSLTTCSLPLESDIPPSHSRQLLPSAWVTTESSLHSPPSLARAQVHNPCRTRKQPSLPWAGFWQVTQWRSLTHTWSRIQTWPCEETAISWGRGGYHHTWGGPAESTGRRDWFLSSLARPHMLTLHKIWKLHHLPHCSLCLGYLSPLLLLFNTK